MKKRFLSLILIFGLSSSLISMKTYAEIITPFIYDDIGYYDIGLLDNQSDLLTNTVNASGIHGTSKSANYFWSTVAALAYASKFGPDAIGNDYYQQIDSHVSYFGMGGGPDAYYYSSDEYKTGQAKYAATVKNAYEEMGKEIIAAYKDADGGDTLPNKIVAQTLDGISDNISGGNAVYFWEGGFKKGENQEGHYVALGVIYSNFRLTPVLPDNVMVSTTVDPPSSKNTVISTGAKNAASIPAQISQSLEQSVTEEVSNSIERSSSYSFSESLEISHTYTSQVTAGLVSASHSLSTTVGFSAEQAFGSAWSESQSKSKTSSYSSAVSLDLPAHSQVYLTQSTGETGCTITYDCPVYLTYDVTLICMSRDPGDSNSTPRANVLCSFHGDARKEFARRFVLNPAGDDDRIDWENGIKGILYIKETYQTTTKGDVQRADQFLSDGIAWGDAYNDYNSSVPFSSIERLGMSIITRMSKNRPMSITGGAITYKSTGTTTDIYEVGPLYPLSSVYVTGPRDYKLQVGDSMYVDSIGLSGEDGSGVEFYGFQSNKGYWSLIDESGGEADENIARIGTNHLTGYTTMTAISAGTVYLKYTVDKNRYADGMVPDTVILPIIPISIPEPPNDQENPVLYTVKASGSMTVVLGEAVSLMSAPGISGAVYDETDKKVTNAVVWETQELEEDGITLNENMLTTTRVGNFHIRALYTHPTSGTILRSNWLPVTAVKSSDTLIGSLLVGGTLVIDPIGGTGSETFSGYRTSVENSVSSIEIVAKAHHRDATIEGVGTHNLLVGDNRFILTVTSPDGTTKEYPITITRADMAVKDKERVSISNIEAAKDLVYTAATQKGYTGTVMVEGNKVTASTLVYTYTSTDGGGYNSTSAPINAGSYKLIISVPDNNSNYMGYSEDILFTIGKKPITVSANAVSKTKGTEDPVFTYTVNPTDGIVGNDIAFVISRAAGTDEGNYPIIITDQNPNYAITYVGNYLTIKNKSSEDTEHSSGGGGGGGGTIYYNITVIQTDGGKISPETIDVEKNGNKTFTITPNESYEIEDVLINNKSVGRVTEYVFEKVSTTATITSKFKKVETKEQTPTTWENPFADVKISDWFYDSVKYVNQNKLMKGVSDMTFAPDAGISRGMFVTVLYRIEGEPEAGTVKFTDVRNDAYYTKAVAWANDNGIVTGVSDTIFAPNDTITREQMAAIIYRYAQFKRKSPLGDWGISMDYIDSDQISDFAGEAVLFCKLKNIMNGNGNNIFAPQLKATRSEAATVLMRVMEELK
ncbi:MAG: S-layer homology domain-containing protein [Desulfitobacteriaceae bacterium]|nr:S-layer homology domain-containing protein [Desulfitobacteriaceae bacterium]